MCVCAYTHRKKEEDYLQGRSKGPAREKERRGRMGEGSEGGDYEQDTKIYIHEYKENYFAC